MIALGIVSYVNERGVEFIKYTEIIIFILSFINEQYAHRYSFNAPAHFGVQGVRASFILNN
jgi:hypothetical protein